MIDPVHLKQYVLEPVLHRLELPAIEDATIQLLGTMAVESDMGFSLHQRGGGPGLGPFSIEPATHACIWENFLTFRPLLADRVEDYLLPYLGTENLIGNLYYATAIARIKYYRSPRKMPDRGDVYGMAKFWRYDYNSSEGAFGDDEAIEKFVEKFNKYVRPIL